MKTRITLDDKTYRIALVAENKADEKVLDFVNEHDHASVSAVMKAEPAYGMGMNREKGIKEMVLELYTRPVEPPSTNHTE